MITKKLIFTLLSASFIFMIIAFASIIVDLRIHSKQINKFKQLKRKEFERKIKR